MVHTTINPSTTMLRTSAALLDVDLLFSRNTSHLQQTAPQIGLQVRFKEPVWLQ